MPTVVLTSTCCSLVLTLGTVVVSSVLVLLKLRLLLDVELVPRLNRLLLGSFVVSRWWLPVLAATLDYSFAYGVSLGEVRASAAVTFS